jgi:hypothetical protein
MMTPTPVAVVPTPVAMVVPSPVVAMSPSNLLRLEAFDLIARSHSRMGILTRFIFNLRLGQQRSGLRSRGKRGRAGCTSKSDFQKLSAFHGVPLMSLCNDAKRVSAPRSEQRLN